MSAVQVKLSIKRHQRAQDVVKAAGATISGSDAMFLNIDQTAMTKLEALERIDQIKQYVQEHGWPLDGSA